MILLKRKVTYTKDKETKETTNYYICEGKKMVQIKPTFPNEYFKLNFLATDFDDYFNQEDK